MKEYVVRAHFTIEAESPAVARERVITFLEASDYIMDQELPGLQCSCVDNLDEVQGDA